MNLISVVHHLVSAGLGEDDQLAGVLGEPDAVGVLAEGHLAGVLVTLVLGLSTGLVKKAPAAGPCKAA